MLENGNRSHTQTEAGSRKQEKGKEKKLRTTIGMNLTQMLSVACFTMAIVITVYVWMDRLRGTNAQIEEAFENDTGHLTLKPSDIEALKSGMNTNPTDADAVNAHKLLLRYIKNDVPKGVKFINDFGKRFFGDDVPVRKDLNIESLLDNYVSPLQRV